MTDKLYLLTEAELRKIIASAYCGGFNNNREVGMSFVDDEDVVCIVNEEMETITPLSPD